MADLTHDYQFELDGLLFGQAAPVFVEEDGFDPGGADWRTQDAEVPQGDGSFFGKDYLEPGSWAWTLGVDRTDPAGALETLAAFTRTWREAGRRLTPGAVATLRYRIAGRNRLVYGRPRRVAPAMDNRLMQGYAPLLADFKLADHLTYDDVEKSVTIGLGGGTTTTDGGGLTAPLSAPISTSRTDATVATREGSVVVGGDAPSWAVVTIRGPVSRPYVTVRGLWTVQLEATLARDEEVVIDSRPWARTVTTSSGASLAGTLTRTSRLARMLMQPGAQQIDFGGSTTEAGAQATVTWRDASYSL